LGVRDRDVPGSETDGGGSNAKNAEEESGNAKPMVGSLSTKVWEYVERCPPP
jgi:hypothetical protein